MAHFDRDGALDPHVRATLLSLAGPGVEMLLVSTGLADGVEAGVDRVIRRDNRGYDFRSWQAGLEVLGGLQGYDEVVLLNDSFYLARAGALPAAFAAMAGRGFDVWGLTASREERFHLQSYFMAFRPAAFEAGWFRRFWAGVMPDGDRAAVIARHELTLAAEARTAGLRVGALLMPALWPGRTAIAERWRARVAVAGRRAAVRTVVGGVLLGENTALRRWRETCRVAGVVKVELLRDNPLGADLAGLEECMETACFARARAHLARVGAPGPVAPP